MDFRNLKKKYIYIFLMIYNKKISMYACTHICAPFSCENLIKGEIAIPTMANVLGLAHEY